MLRHAFYWRSGGTVEESSLWRYVSGWGRRGDSAVIALEGGFAVGAAWYRLFSRDEPGFGFMDEETPEVANELIDIMIKENARERLEAQQISDRVAITAVTVARVLGSSGRSGNSGAGA